MAVSKSEIIDTLQLINSENVGPVTFYKLVKDMGSVTKALAAAIRLRKVRICPRDWAEKEYAKAQDMGIELITFADERYPHNLRLIEDCPPVLYTKGNLEILQNKACVAIVGSRNASINGRKTASRIAYDLSNANICVVSGLARGIDAAAHKGAMYAQNQQGDTIGVVGCGVDVIYPTENTELYQHVAAQGCIISELPLGTAPQANFFPRRNRIVAALGLGTVVVEATTKSGSLITAELASSMGRKVFAIPGSPTDARAEGPNKLIKDGAVLVENAQDIIRLLPASPEASVRKHKPVQKPLVFATNEIKNTKAEAKIVDYLTSEGVYVDEIIRLSGLSSSEVAMQLLELEMDGKIERQSGNKVALIK